MEGTSLHCGVMCCDCFGKVGCGIDETERLFYTKRANGRFQLRLFYKKKRHCCKGSDVKKA